MDTVIFSDIDGTLLDNQHHMSENTQYAIRELQNKGIRFVILSARLPLGIYALMETYQIQCYVGAFSGGLILDDKRRVLYHRGFSKTQTADILRFIDASGIDVDPNIYSLEQWVVRDRNHPMVQLEESIQKVTATEGTLEDIVDDQINKIMCSGDPEEILKIEKLLCTSFPEYSIVRSLDRFLEIMPSGISKAQTVRFLCEKWDIDPQQAIAFGDNYNDQEMLELVGQGFLMDNGPEELKQRIVLHADSNEKDGVYQKLIDLDLIRPNGGW